MDDLLACAVRLWTESPPTNDLRLVGGLAVRLLVGPGARLTRDIDVVAMNEEVRRGVLAALRREGFRTGSAAGWERAVGPGRVIVDVAPNPVPNPRTFETLALRGAPLEIATCHGAVVVAAPDDLVLLKLFAGRDQDLVDLALLVARRDISAAAIAATAEADDVERRIAEGAMRARLALGTGLLDDVFGELLLRAPSSEERAALTVLLADLARRGL